MATISTTQSRLKFLSLWSSDDANKGDDNTAMNVASFPSVCSFLGSNDQQTLRGRVYGWGGGWRCLTQWHKLVWRQCREQCESYNWRSTLSLKVVVEITVNAMKLSDMSRRSDWTVWKVTPPRGSWHRQQVPGWTSCRLMSLTGSANRNVCYLAKRVKVNTIASSVSTSGGRQTNKIFLLATPLSGILRLVAKSLL